MNDKLLIITKLKRTIEYIDKSLDNYPHRYIELKNKIRNDLDTMLEYCYIANQGYDREKYQKLLIVKIKMIDYYLKTSYKKELISKKKYESISKHLLDINKMIYGWINSDEENKQYIQ